MLTVPTLHMSHSIIKLDNAIDADLRKPIRDRDNVVKSGRTRKIEVNNEKSDSSRDWNKE